MKALAEQAPGMRRRPVIVGRQRAARLASRPDMAKIAALGGVAGKRLGLAPRLGRRRVERDLAAALDGKPVRADSASR